MRTIDSRTYTNVALTVLILLLLVLVTRPYISLPSAHAAPGDLATMGSESTKKVDLLNPYGDVATALRDIAASNREAAAAIRETAKSQDAVAKAIQGLGIPTAPK